MTFGMRDQGYEIALVEALANLKAEVEGTDIGVLEEADDSLSTDSPSPQRGEGAGG